MSTIRVLTLGWEFPPLVNGGLGIACLGLSKALAKKVDLRVIVPKADPSVLFDGFQLTGLNNVSYREVEQVDRKYSYDSFALVERAPIELDPYTTVEGESGVVQFTKEGRITFSKTHEADLQLFRNKEDLYAGDLALKVIQFSKIAVKVALQQDFDIIHAHDWLTYYAGIAAKRVSGKPLVVHMHATEYDRSGENVNTQVYAIERAGMHAADRVIAVSNLTRNIVINRYGVPADKVVTVHNAVRFAGGHCKMPERGVDDKIVTFLGRITYQKGPDYFVEAAAKVLKKVPNVRFVMAGSGDMMNHVIRRVARLGIADRFHFTGFLRGEDVHKMFQLSDVYVMPSVSEPFGISPLEAMRSNVPVIISKQSGVAEVLDYAVKVDYWDVDALADAIYGLIKYPALSGMFASKGLEEVTNLKWNDAAAKIKSVYEAVIEENKKQLK